MFVTAVLSHKYEVLWMLLKWKRRLLWLTFMPFWKNIMGFKWFPLSPGVRKLGQLADNSTYFHSRGTKRGIHPKLICGLLFWWWYTVHYWLCGFFSYFLIVLSQFCSKKISIPNSELPGEAAPRQAWLWSTCWERVSLVAETPPLRPRSSSSYQMGGLRATWCRRLHSSKRLAWSCLPWAFAIPGMFFVCGK